MKTLVLNAGSSSVKFTFYEGSEKIVWGLAEGLGTVKPKLTVKDKSGLSNLVEMGNDHNSAISKIIEVVGKYGTPDVVGHRVVHGGDKFSQPVLIDDSILDDLRSLIPLAPLHQPHNLAGIDAVKKVLPEIRQVSCFDTAFHSSQPALATALAIPSEWAEKGVRRYGFHGMSYEGMSYRLPAILGSTSQGKVIALHLGNGSSACAMDGLVSKATSMGFSALDGLVMGTRCGNLDPGVVLHFLREGMTPNEIEGMLYKKSGLFGVSGYSQDMRELQQKADDGDSKCQFAIDLYVEGIVANVGNLAARIGGFDVLAFTGGIGENSSVIRAKVVDRLSWFGFSLDPQKSQVKEGLVSSENSKPVVVIPADEEAVIRDSALALI